MSTLWPLVPPGATDWLLELCGDGVTGFMPPAMPDAVWVLNAMYEHEQGPADVSYHEYHQARLAEGASCPISSRVSTLTPWASPREEAWAEPGTQVPAGGDCAGPSLPGEPAPRPCLTG